MPLLYLHEALRLDHNLSDGTTLTEYLVYPGKTVPASLIVIPNIPWLGSKVLCRPLDQWYIRNFKPLTDIEAGELTIVPTMFFYKTLSSNMPPEFITSFIKCILITEYLYLELPLSGINDEIINFKIFPFEHDTNPEVSTYDFERKCHIVFNCSAADLCVVNTPELRNLFNKNDINRQLIINAYNANRELMEKLGCINCFEGPRVHRIEIYD